MVAQRTITVGDSVQFNLGSTTIRGRVVEDRGPIGADRVRLFGVRIPNDPYGDDVIEMPEDALALAGNGAEPLPVESIVRYLEQGGLVEILKPNLSGATYQQPVWLTRDSLGNVVHTFNPERGIVGGLPAPYPALRDNRVLKSKLDDVLEFLSKFGLTKDAAKRVVKAVGTAP